MFIALLIPLDYSKYFLPVASESTISKVLVQEYDLNQEHVAYYLSRSLFRPKMRFSHVEKLSLEVVHAI